MQIVTFIFEQGLLSNPRKILGKKFWTFVEKTHDYLGVLEQQTNNGNPIPPLGHRKDCSSYKDLWTHFQKAVGGMKYPGLLWCFILHCEALLLIPLRNRTAGSRGCNPDLDAHLQGDFLPKVFSIIDSYLSEWDLELDLDGNVFTALLEILLSDTTLSLPQRLGGSLSQIVAPLPDDALHLKALGSAFSVQASRPQTRVSTVAQTKLLPFHHDVFDEGFSLIDLSSDDSEEDAEYGALEFGTDTAFDDKFHWHNTKRHILPKHPGGNREINPSDERKRMKAMKWQQRFMSRLTADAATLTGALGVRFNRLTIVTGGTEEAPGKYTGHPVRYVLVILFLRTNMRFTGQRTQETREERKAHVIEGEASCGNFCEEVEERYG